MTLNDWNKRQDLKLAWKAFCKSEAGQSLRQILMTLGTPVPTLPPAGVDFIDWNATLNSRREGYYEAIRILTALSEEDAEPTNLPAPWEKTAEEKEETN
jgi:hypothetical protein